MAIYIEDLPFKHGDFPYSFVYVYQRVSCNNNVGRDANGRISSTDFSVVFPLTWLASQWPVNKQLTFPRNIFFPATFWFPSENYAHLGTSGV